MKNKALSLILSICLVLTVLPLGSRRAHAAGNYEYAILGMKSFTVTQTWTDTYSHNGTCCIDIAGGDGIFRAPFSGYVKILGLGNNTICFQSAEPVNYADGSVGIMCVTLAHCENLSEFDLYNKANNHTLISQGEPIYRQGSAGLNYRGDHIHLECIRGEYAGTVYVDATKYTNTWGKVLHMKNAEYPGKCLYLLDEGGRGGAFGFDKTSYSVSSSNPEWKDLIGFQYHNSLKCDHSSADYRGICGSCGQYVPESDSAYQRTRSSFSSAAKFRALKDVKLCAAPYSQYESSGTALGAGSYITVAEEFKNGDGEWWYRTDTGQYVRVGNDRFVRVTGVVYMDAVGVSVSGGTVKLSTKVNKSGGMTAQKYGIYIYDPFSSSQLQDLAWALQNNGEDLKTAYEASFAGSRYRGLSISSDLDRLEWNDPNGSATKNRASYSFSLDLKSEAGLKLSNMAGNRFLAQLFVVVDGVEYTSDVVQFKAGDASGTSVFIENPSNKLAAYYYDDTADQGGGSGSGGQSGGGSSSGGGSVIAAPGSAKLSVDRSSLPANKSVEYVTFTVNVQNVSSNTIYIKRADGSEEYHANIGAGSEYMYSFELAGTYTAYAVCENSAGKVTSNTVTITVTDNLEFFPGVNGLDGPIEDIALDSHFKYSGKDGGFRSFGVLLYDEDRRQIAQGDDSDWDWPSSWRTTNRSNIYAGFDVQTELNYDLEPGTVYYYRIYVDFVKGGMIYSDYYRFQTPGRRITIPENFTSNLSTGTTTVNEEVTVSFDAEYAEGFQVVISASDGRTVSDQTFGLTSGLTFKLEDPGTYTVKVKAFNKKGSTEWRTHTLEVVPKDVKLEIKASIDEIRDDDVDFWVSVNYENLVGRGDFGIELFDESGKLLGSAQTTGFVSSEGIDKPHNAYHADGFSAKASLGVTLEPGTTYQYRPFLNASGKKYYGQVGSFKTTGLKTSVTTSAALSNPFTDVPKNAWYYSVVSRAYAEGLINGKVKNGQNVFDPNANMTMAEVLKLAACVRQLLVDGKVTLTNSKDGSPWYMSYYNYLKDNGRLQSVLIDYTNFKKPVTRGEMVRIFWNVMPASSLKQRNVIGEGAIPDVDTHNSEHVVFSTAVYSFYRAGIVSGSDEYGTFHPDNNIRRSEVAAILVRIIDPSMRVAAPAKLGRQ